MSCSDVARAQSATAPLRLPPVAATYDDVWFKADEYNAEPLYDPLAIPADNNSWNASTVPTQRGMQGLGGNDGMMSGRGLGMGGRGSGIRYQWLADSDTDGFGMQEVSAQAGSMIPPIFIAPMNVNVGAGISMLDSPTDLALPGELYQLSLGLGMPVRFGDDSVVMLQTNVGMSGEISTQGLQLGLKAIGQRRISDRVTFMLMGGANTLVDTSRVEADEVQLMLMAMGRIHWTDTLQMMVGAGYMGSQAPFPVMPMAGLEWKPRDDLHFNIMLPNPRVSYRMTDTGDSQWWSYLGGGPGGNTWYIERPDGITRPLRYSHFQLSLGVERRSIRGIAGGIEIGYAFGRSLAIDEEALDRAFDNTLSISTSFRF
ncbi:MAG: DUF6268 family outer membrane beta-barrel protein [Pirellulales bacterium]|nr:DUF6268 family outer membrane beta-barrel protein [Pirellulales bacterium]